MKKSRRFVSLPIGRLQENFIRNNPHFKSKPIVLESKQNYHKP